MRLAIIGGGGFRVPLVYRALLGSPATVVLHDTDPARVAAIARVLAGLADGTPDPPRVQVIGSLRRALEGADYVFCALRVGGLRGRVADERVALELGLLGQETVGPGGVAYALRSVPVMRSVAQAVAEVAPDAWTINFTNPVGVVTEAMAAILGPRVVGVCDSPVGLFRRVAWLLGEPAERVWFDYSGLNHLGWLTAALVRGTDRLPGLLAGGSLARAEEGRLFGAARLRELGAIPNEYLHYYYDTAAAIAAAAGARTRGEYLAEQQEAFYSGVREASPADAAALWQRVRADRDASYLPAAQRSAATAGEPVGGGYEDVALAVMRALAGGPPATLVLNLALRHSASAAGGAGWIGSTVDGDAVVEVPCLVDARGVHPVVTGPLPAHAADLVSAVKATDRAILAAAGSGSAELAARAFARHPMVGSAELGRRLLAGYAAAHPELAQFR